MERDVLEKSVGRADATTQATYHFIQQHQQDYPVRVMCRILQVSPSGYYRWRKQPHSRRAKQINSC